MDEFTLKNFNKNSFNKLDDFEKYEVIQELKKEHDLNNQNIADLLHVKQKTIPVYMSNWKKAWDKLNTAHKKMKQKDNLIDANLADIPSFKTENISMEDETSGTNISNLEDIGENIPVFNYNIRGIYDGKELSEELNEISKLVRNYDNINVQLKINK